ncbi:MAG: hypothetical protein AMXMBFR84_40300 [Candidatus Hydrogenedentota bacterium]
MGVSQFLDEKAIRGLERLGDIILPREGRLPSFSEVGCVEHVDDVLAYAPPEDAASLNTVLGVLSFVPTFGLRGVVWCMHRADNWPGPLGSTLRLLNMGVRGVVLSLYYSGKTGARYTGPDTCELIGFALNRVPRAES